MDKICVPSDMNEFVSECIFYNDNIYVGGRHIFYRQWLDQDVYQIHHLLNDQGEFLRFNAFQLKYPQIQTNFLEYQGVVNAVRMYAARVGIVMEPGFQIKEPLVIKLILSGKNTISSLLKDKKDLVPAGFQKWNNQYNNNLNWNKILDLCHNTTKECKLKWFQLRILHRILPTNRFLFVRNVKDDNSCSFCGEHEESINHLLWNCEIVQNFWNQLENLLLNSCPNIVNLRFDEELVLFGTRQNMYADVIFDLILLLAIYYVYSCK